MPEKAAPVSVVVPAFDAAETLARALDSVCAQTLAPSEIVVVDDGSRDDTAAVAARYPVRLVRHAANRGGAAALLTGVEAAQFPFVAFLDADDEWYPDKLAAQMAAIEDAPLCGTAFDCVTDGRVTGNFGTAAFPHGPDAFWRNLLETSAVLQSSALARRDAVLRVGIDTSLRTGYDQALFVRLAATGPVAFVHTPLVAYHDMPGSLTKTPDPANVRRVLALHRSHIALFADRLSPRDRRRLTARRESEAAVDLFAAGAFTEATTLALRAAAGGDRPLENLARLARYALRAGRSST
jgi:glycosyltransferase involved in cell wall biosynthesis